MKQSDGVIMPKSYVNFEVSDEVVSKTYEALQLAKQSGTIRKGANEVTKSIERGLASFVVIAADVDPEEVVVHLPVLCGQKKIAYSYVPSKTELGKAIGLNISCAAIAVENAGKASQQIKEIISRVVGVTPHEQAQKPAPKEQGQKPAPKEQVQKPAPTQAQKPAPKEQTQKPAPKDSTK
jgi:large subunit ribosomal protein L7Ae